MLSDAAVDLWLLQHVMWGAIYAMLGLRWAPTYGFILSWEVWEAVGRQLVPDDGIFGPEPWDNIVLDIVSAIVVFHLTRALWRVLVGIWTSPDPARAVTPLGRPARRPATDDDAVPEQA